MNRTLALCAPLVLAAATLVGSCAPAESVVDPALKPYVELFFKEAKARSLSFDDTKVSARLVPGTLQNAKGEPLIAQCDTFHTDSPTAQISVSQDFWNQTADDEVSRRATVFHELGHCILGRDHLTRTLKTIMSTAEIPVSLMYPRAFVSSEVGIRRFYLDNENHYIDELFGLAENLPSGG